MEALPWRGVKPLRRLGSSTQCCFARTDPNGTNLRVFSDIYDEIACRGTTSKLPIEDAGDSRIPLCNEGVVRVRLEVIDFAVFPLKLVPFRTDPGYEGLVMDSVLAAEAHGTHAAAVKRIEQCLALIRRIAESAVAAGADDGGVCGFGIGWHRLHTPVCMLVMMPGG